MRLIKQARSVENLQGLDYTTILNAFCIYNRFPFFSASLQFQIATRVKKKTFKEKQYGISSYFPTKILIRVFE